MEVVEGEVVGGKISLRQLNNKAIQKLYELVDALDSKSEPELIQACVESLAKLNSSLRNTDILEKEVSEEERAAKRRSDLAEELLKRKG